MSHRRSREAEAPPVAVPVSDSSVLVTDQVIDQAKAAADAELAKRKQALKKEHDREVKELEDRFAAELKTIKATLDESERNERTVQQATEQAARLAKDALHKASLIQLENQNELEKEQFEERKSGWIRNENTVHAHWVAANPYCTRNLDDLEKLKQQYVREKVELAKRLNDERAVMEKEWRRKERDWEATCNATNSKHSSNLMMGLLVGGFVGYVLDRGARM